MPTTPIGASFPATLTPQEWKLVSSIRAVPESALKRRLFAVIGEMVAFSSAPDCHEVQADGVPCGDVHKSCDDCGEAITVLDEIGAKLTK
jgi:hypothetical protein